MNVKRWLGLAGVASLPLAMLVAAPAQAEDRVSAQGGKPTVSVHADYGKIKVRYSCVTAGNDPDDKGYRKDRDKYGTLRLYSEDWMYYKYVKCNGEEGLVVVYRQGGKVRAVLEDPDGDRASDST